MFPLNTRSTGGFHLNLFLLVLLSHIKNISALPIFFPNTEMNLTDIFCPQNLNFCDAFSVINIVTQLAQAKVAVTKKQICCVVRHRGVEFKLVHKAKISSLSLEFYSKVLAREGLHYSCHLQVLTYHISGLFRLTRIVLLCRKIFGRLKFLTFLFSDTFFVRN